jgi:hypothetical protein
MPIELSDMSSVMLLLNGICLYRGNRSNHQGAAACCYFQLVSENPRTKLHGR